MCRLPRHFFFVLSLAVLSMAMPLPGLPLPVRSRAPGGPLLYYSRPTQDDEPSDQSDPDMRLLEHYLRTRGEDPEYLNTRESETPPQDSSSEDPQDLAYLYNQLDLVTTIRNLIGGKNTVYPGHQDGMALPEDVLVSEEIPRSYQERSNIAELYDRINEVNNMGARLRRAANNAGVQSDSKVTLEELAEGKSGEKGGGVANCRPGREEWPACRFLNKIKIESFHVFSQQPEQNKEGARRDGEQKEVQGSVRANRELEGTTDKVHRVYGNEDEHSGTDRSGLRRKRSTKNEETPTSSVERGSGKRVPDFHSWGGKRASQVDLNEIYSSDSSNAGGKRATEFNSWGGKRGPSFNSWGGKRAPEFNSWGGKRAPSFNSWGGKRAPEFNSWGGKRTPSFNSWGGKRAPEFNSWGGKRTPSFNSWGGKRAPEFNSWGGKRSPSFNSWGGKRAPEFNSWGGKRNTAFNSWGGKRSTKTLQQWLGPETTSDMTEATNENVVDAREIGLVKASSGKRGNMEGVRAMNKSPNLPVMRIRAAGFYPWGGKRSDSTSLE